MFNFLNDSSIDKLFVKLIVFGFWLFVATAILAIGVFGFWLFVATAILALGGV